MSHRPLVMLVLGAAAVLTGARAPIPGGRITLYVPDDEEGRAIAEALVTRQSPSALATLEVVPGSLPSRAGPGEIVVRSGAADPREGIAVAYRLHADALVPQLRALLAPEAFAPLVAPSARCGWPLDLGPPPSRNDVAAGALEGARVALETRERGRRIAQLARRVRLLLESEGAIVEEAGAGDRFDVSLRLVREVFAGLGPEVDDRGASPHGRLAHRWIVLALGFDLERGSDVAESAHGGFWLAVPPPEP